MTPQSFLPQERAVSIIALSEKVLSIAARNPIHRDRKTTNKQCHSKPPHSVVEGLVDVCFVKLERSNYKTIGQSAWHAPTNAVLVLATHAAVAATCSTTPPDGVIDPALSPCNGAACAIRAFRVLLLRWQRKQGKMFRRATTTLTEASTPGVGAKCSVTPHARVTRPALRLEREVRVSTKLVEQHS